jgi:hypothetical protein
LGGKLAPDLGGLNEDLSVLGQVILGNGSFEIVGQINGIFALVVSIPIKKKLSRRPII